MADVINLTSVKKKKSRRRFFRRLLVLIFLTAAVVIVLMNKDTIEEMGILDFAEEKLFGYNTNPGFPVDYMGGNGNALYKVSDGVLVATDTYLLTYSTKGSLKNYAQHSFYNLRADTYKNYELIYDRGGKELFIYRDGEKKYSKTLTGQITDAVYSSKGGVAVLTDTGSFATRLTVFNGTLSKEVFGWYDTEYQAFAVAFAGNGEDFAVACYGVSEGQLLTKIIFFSLSSNDVQAELTLQGTMAVSIGYKSNGTLMVIGDDRTVVVDGKGNVTGTYSYEGRTLSFYQQTSSEGVLLIFEPTNEENSSSLVFLNKKAEEEYAATVNENIRDVSLSDKTAAVLTERSVFYYSFTENTVKQIATESDGYRVLLKNRDIYVLGFSQLKKLSPN